MIRLYIKKKFYSYERVIFPNGKTISKADVIRYMRYRNPDMLGFREKEVYLTPVIDLTLSYEDIFKKYDKKLRNQVRRAAKEDIDYKIYDCFNLAEDEEMLRDIVNKYYKFCDNLQLPEMKHNLIWQEFLQFIDNGSIMISKADYENGWVYHIYQCDGEHAMLWFSFSDYREQSGNTQLPGWANRALHDLDIQYFQKKGYREYDWGNIASDTEPNNIDRFKMSFGGEIVPVYCSFVANTLKGKLLVLLRSIRNRSKL